MAEHQKASQKNKEDAEQKHRLKQKEPQTSLDHFHAWEQGTVAISETPFWPRMDKHAELLAMPHSDEQRASLILRLQQTYGNRYVQRLIESMRGQAKLTVNGPNDIYEQEADSVAHAVSNHAPIQVQRQEEEEELQTKHADFIQRQITNLVPEVDPDIEGKISAARGSGESLPEEVRVSMEQAFGTDFSGVRVHSDANADALSKSLQARAFTTGQDIFFRSGEYNAASSAGQQLLAHELAHTIQQAEPRVKSLPSPIKKTQVDVSHIGMKEGEKAKIRGVKVLPEGRKGPHIGTDKKVFNESKDKFEQLKEEVSKRFRFRRKKKIQEWANSYCFRRIEQGKDPIDKQRIKNAVLYAYYAVFNEHLRLTKKYEEYEPRKLEAVEIAGGVWTMVKDIIGGLADAGYNLINLVKGKNLEDLWEGALKEILSSLIKLKNMEVWGLLISVVGIVAGFITSVISAIDSLMGIRNRLQWFIALVKVPKAKSWSAKAQWGAIKVGRGVLNQIGKFLKALADLVTTVVSIVGMFVPVAALAAFISKFALFLVDTANTLIRSGWGIVKFFLGIKGKFRREAAEEIVEAVANGDLEAAKLVHSLNPFGTITERTMGKALFWKRGQQRKIREVVSEKDPGELIKKFEWLLPNDRKVLQEGIAERLKST